MVESLNILVMEGRNAVGRTSAFLSTQIPFGYVQLLSFMVKVPLFLAPARWLSLSQRTHSQALIFCLPARHVTVFVQVFLLSRSVDVGFYLALNMGRGGFQMWTHGLRFLQLVINVSSLPAVERIPD